MGNSPSKKKKKSEGLMTQSKTILEVNIIYLKKVLCYDFIKAKPAKLYYENWNNISTSKP